MEKKQQKRKLSKKQKKRIQQRNRNLAFCGMVLFLVILIGILVFTMGKDSKRTQGEASDNEERVENDSSATQTNTPTSEATPEADVVSLVELAELDLDSTSVVLVRREDNQVVCEMDAERVLYPASMTKIMTALIAIENISNLSDTMKIKQSTYDEVYLQGASLAGFPCGEEVPVIDVIYGIMLPSGAECCVAIAEYLYGSEDAFVQVMNAKAAELGMTSTHFVTSTGLHDEQHYTTVKDLAKLVQYALENETFKMIYCSKTYTTAPTKKYPAGLTFYNTMFAKMGTKKLDNGEILGGKTGYTSEAGNCLASYAVVNDVEYILVTAGSADESKLGAVEDAISIYNQLAEQ